jgi:DNA-binding NtrC family response regulator
MSGKAKILVIDDDETIRENLVLALEAEGYEVDNAENGLQAIDKSFKNFYNLAIVDWRLPDIEGTELISKLKETTPKMAKIMLTGFPSMDSAVKAVNNRTDAFLVKPVNFTILLEKITTLLKEQEQARKDSEEKVAEFIQTKAKELIQNRNLQSKSKCDT